MRLEQAFGENLRSLRLQRNLTQADLALRSGLTRRYLIKLEQGLTNPTLSVIVKLASCLEVKAHDLVRLAVDSLGSK